MISLTFSVQSIIIFDTLVSYIPCFAFITMLNASIEPIEADLARQVEYDMDEQGVYVILFDCPTNIFLQTRSGSTR